MWVRRVCKELRDLPAQLAHKGFKGKREPQGLLDPKVFRVLLVLKA